VSNKLGRVASDKLDAFHKWPGARPRRDSLGPAKVFCMATQRGRARGSM